MQTQGEIWCGSGRRYTDCGQAGSAIVVIVVPGQSIRYMSMKGKKKLWHSMKYENCFKAYDGINTVVEDPTGYMGLHYTEMVHFSSWFKEFFGSF